MPNGFIYCYRSKPSKEPRAFLERENSGSLKWSYALSLYNYIQSNTCTCLLLQFSLNHENIKL